jgi:F-type H+-transporting ATPase subunit delta
VFEASQWAAAYRNECEKQAKRMGRAPDLTSGLDFLRAVVPALAKKAELIGGASSAAQVDRFIGAAAKEAGLADTIEKSTEIRAARALLFLLIRQNCFQCAGALIASMQKLVEASSKTLQARLDAAREPESAFLDKVRAALAAQTGDVAVNLTVKVRPDLLGGFRVQVGSVLLDYSIAGQLAQLERKLREGAGR